MLLLFVSLSTSPLPSPSLSKPPPLTRDPNERIAHNKQPFTAPSAAFWCLLSLATVVDHRRTRQLSAVTRGASVRRGIRWVVALYALDSLLLLALSLLDSSAPAPGARPPKLQRRRRLRQPDPRGLRRGCLPAAAAGGRRGRGDRPRRRGPGPAQGQGDLVPLVYLVTTLAVDLAEVKKNLFLFGGGWGRRKRRDEVSFRSPSSSKKGEKLNLEKNQKNAPRNYLQNLKKNVKNRNTSP